MENTLNAKFRVLTLSLMFSGALNIGLLATLASFFLQEKQISLSVPMPVRAAIKQESTNCQLLALMSKLTFRELVSFLTNKEIVEEGYSKRDLAVSALVAFHHFNLEKALSASPAQKRVLQISETQKVEVFPGFSDDQFEAIIRYAYEEKWPLTSKGLFSLLQKWEAPRDETLEQAFRVTPEFHALQVLFQKTEASQDPALLLDLAIEGNWDLLDRFFREQSQMLDLSVEKRRRLLLSYLALQSPTAAQLILRIDFPFALKRLEDRGILDLLSLLTNRSEEAERFCLELLRSTRSDAIWQAAAARLYAFSGEAAPASLDPKETLARFAPHLALEVQSPRSEPVSVPAPIPAVQPPLLHVVREGESLWKIARQYKAKVDEIVQLNGIDKDRLRPGMTLRIPNQSVGQGTGSEPPR